VTRSWAPGRPLPLWDRFWGHVDPNGPVPERCPQLGPCWLWTARLNHLGYGRFFLTSDTPRISVPPHRWLYEQLTGEPFPAGKEPDHLCFNRGCVNPAHIEPVTHRENARRGTSMVAINARKTHCPYGHPYDAENTRIGPRGKRYCRTCARRYVQETMLRRKARMGT
jgi:hypothetical protein